MLAPRVKKLLCLEDNNGQYPRRGAEHDPEKKLGRWISNVRTQRADFSQGRGALSPSLAKDLEALPGWTWNVPASLHLQCEFVSEDGVECTESIDTHKGDDGRRYCKAHLTDVRGRKRNRNSSDHTRIVHNETKRRLCCKQRPPPAHRARAYFDSCGCTSRDATRERVGTGSYCSFHARMVRRDAAPAVALCSLDDWSPASVSVHSLGELQRCEACNSWNFPEEAVGQGNKRHYNICCSNGKTLDLAPFEEPEPVLRDLLVSTSLPARAFREAIRSYNAALGFISVGANVAPPPGHRF